MEIYIILILMVAAFVVNFFSVMTGGAGLILTPLLITFGLPPVNAIAATKFSYLGTAITGTYKFHKVKQIDYHLAIPLTVFSIFGAIIGAFVAIEMEPQILQVLIALMMLGILVLIIANRKIGESDHSVPLSKTRIAIGGILILLAVALGTLAGGGLVVLISYILVLLFGESFLHSAGTQKIINDVAFLIIAVIFVWKGVVDFAIAIPLLVASMIGGWFGATYGINKGAHWVKNVFMVVIILLSVKLVFSL